MCLLVDVVRGRDAEGREKGRVMRSLRKRTVCSWGALVVECLGDRKRESRAWVQLKTVPRTAAAGLGTGSMFGSFCGMVQ